MATYKPPQSPGVSRSLLGACVIACCALLPPCATAAPDPSEGAGHTEQLDHAQTWRLDGWRAFQKSFEMDGQNQVLLQVAPESEAPGFRIAVTTAHMEALTLLADHMAERALLDSYIKRLFFKLGATPERVTTWECSLQAGRTTSPSDPTTPLRTPRRSLHLPRPTRLVARLHGLGSHIRHPPRRPRLARRRRSTPAPPIGPFSYPPPPHQAHTPSFLPLTPPQNQNPSPHLPHRNPQNTLAALASAVY